MRKDLIHVYKGIQSQHVFKAPLLQVLLHINSWYRWIKPKD